MQAILTRYINPTSAKGARIKAACAASHIVIDYPHELSGEAVHRAAAEALVQKLGWVGPRYGTLHGGELPTGDYCFVLVQQPEPAPARNPADVSAMRLAADKLSYWPHQLAGIHEIAAALRRAAE